MNYTSIVALLGQTFISLYPILIKRVSATMPQQLAGRFGTFAALSLLFGGTSTVAAALGSVGAAAQTLAAGGINILHVLESYRSFQLLPAGVAYTIIYTYPFWNLIGARLLLGETISTGVLPIFALAFIGVVLVAAGGFKMRGDDEGSKEDTIRGLLAATAGAITETILFLIVRGSDFMGPMENIGRLYIGGAALLTASPAIRAAIPTVPAAIPTFNAAIGFTSMTALIWSAKRIPTYIYSLIAFVGLVASYGWGLLFADEVPSLLALAGSAIVGLAVWLLPNGNSS
jgi:drug/metabolite transporter (DMT)-like permease